MAYTRLSSSNSAALRLRRVHQSHDCDDYSEDDSYDDSGDDDCHDNHASADLNSYGFVGGSKSAEPKLPTFSAGLNSLESRSSQS